MNYNDKKEILKKLDNHNLLSDKSKKSIKELDAELAMELDNELKLKIDLLKNKLDNLGFNLSL